MKTEVTYFFRKPFTDYFSIEELFGFIQSSLPANILVSNHFMKKMSTGIFNRIYNCFEVIRHQGQVNHITGDVHYISFFMKKSKTILTIHDLVPLTRGRALNRFLIRLIWYTIPCSRVSYITTISEFTRKELLKHVKVSPEKIVVIHDCVSPKIKYTPAPFNSMKPDILQVGTAHNKNLENVIPAIAGLPVRLTILGHLLEHQRQLLEEYRIEYDNYFNLKFEEVIERYRQADLVMFASKYEGFGLPVVEANMIGRPIITSNVASLPEIAGDAALMVDPSDVSQIREAVLRIINDPSLREDLIAKGRKNVERFQPGFIANEYAKLYEKVTNRTQSH